MFKHKEKDNNSNKKKKDKKKKSSQKLTRQQKKELKEKRKAFKKKQSKYEIEGGIGGDHDPRTKRDVKTLIICMLGFSLILASVVTGVFFNHAYSNYKKNNTTELGTTLRFSKTDDAKVKINEVWTDKKREVTVAKLGYPTQTRKLLSTKGKNYKIYMKAKGERPKAQMAYGILGNEGDGYLFIKGKLKDQPYNIGIENTISLTTESSGKTNSDSLTSDNEENLETAISSMNQDGSSNSWFNSKADKQAENAKSKNDFIKFIINPYSKSTKVYKGSFLTPSGDIDYSKVVSQTSVDKSLNSIDKQIDKRKDNLDTLKTSKTEFEQRVKDEKKKDKKKDSKNKNNQTTDNEKNLEDVKKAIKEEKEGIDDLQKERKQFEKADFNKDSFGEMQTKSKIY
ncbi:hypothetical protein [Staphylococcus haemolyticus]|uniref:hypothetical protein n=1 Tax=Staphylococcus haemolyticus TaxID=1283 RepID=UPI0010ACE59B|nr:hypothetical protein [Staphylococcus haemolyticus]HCV2365100.1 hypothetical protein [Staphylococcus aureus]TJX74042.1 hypothetical protein FAF40_01605 [Staphylococcus haemolyticus]HCV6078411.1 hypothetical protein [Staphylococcus aureus]HDF1966517.1 hypothetical protein [Staphylococcus aureus]HDJ5786337.1 hypothetical protein [Staphylococcus aureus]